MVSSNYLIKASRKASKLLNRDFCELETMQQSSSSLISGFVNKSLERTHDILIDEISRIRNVYFSEDEFYQDGGFQKKEGFLMVEMIDSLYNFSRSIPAFGMVITYVDYSEELQKHYAYSSIIDLPLMNQIFIFQKDGGAYIEDSLGSKKRVYPKRFGSVELALAMKDLSGERGLNFDLEILTKDTRLKIKKNQDKIQGADIVDSFENDTENCSIDKGKNPNNNQEKTNQDKIKKSLEFRNFGSDVYHIFLMLSNKADAVLVKKPNITLDYTLRLIGKEVGLKLSKAGDLTILKS